MTKRNENKLNVPISSDIFLKRFWTFTLIFETNYRYIRNRQICEVHCFCEKYKQTNFSLQGVPHHIRLFLA